MKIKPKASCTSLKRKHKDALLHSAREYKFLLHYTRVRENKIKPLRSKPNHIRVAFPWVSFNFWTFRSDTEGVFATCSGIPHEPNLVRGTRYWMESSISFLQETSIYDNVRNIRFIESGYLFFITYTNILNHFPSYIKCLFLIYGYK